MSVQPNEIVTFQDVTLFARNFAGTKFGDGKRTFGFILDVDTAQAMLADGWPVKQTRPPKENVPEDWEPRWWLKVNVSYKFRPPKVVTIGSRGMVALDEEALDVLDWASFETVDLSVRARFWEMNGTTGLQAQLSEMYATLEESPLAIKYGAAQGSDFDFEDESAF